MRTVKDVSVITGICIRTLRYYDEIGLLVPTQTTLAGYRLYDEKALAQLQEIMFFRELEIPLADIKRIMEDPHYSRKQALLTQKSLLIKKRNRMNGLIELIENMIGGVNTMDFEAFDNEDVKKIVEHSINQLKGDEIDKIVNKFGSMEEYKAMLENNLKSEETSTQLIKIYGSKDKAIEASLNSVRDEQKQKQVPEEIDSIYKQFYVTMQEDDKDKRIYFIKKLESAYKNMLHLDDTRYFLLETAKHLENVDDVLAQATDQQYGIGVSGYIGNTINEYYGA